MSADGFVKPLPGLSSDGTVLADPTPAERESALVRRLGTGDWLNPITVKEIRQALQGKQFRISFGLLLAAVWLVSIVGTSLIWDRTAAAAGGGAIFLGYFWVLAFAAIVIVPVQAYRSMLAERDGGTYELLQITTLAPWQIISGKLCSSLVQLLIFYSAIAPCIAFTYVLRGIGMSAIVITLGGLGFFSIGLCVLSIMLAAGMQSKGWQIISMLAHMAGLVWCFFMVCALTSEGLWRGGELHSPPDEFWPIAALIVSMYTTYLAIAFAVAAASVTFPTDDRSTIGRAAILVQFCLAAGWCGFLVFFVREKGNGGEEILAVFTTLTAFHLYFYGMFLTGESGTLSVRVRRTLPRTEFGRALFMWLRPGSATGLIFCVCLMATAVVLALGVTLFFPGSVQQGNMQHLEIWLFGCLAYLTLFLAAGRLLHRFLQKIGSVMLAAPMVHILTLLIGMLLPVFFHMLFQGDLMRNRMADSPLLCVTNPFLVFWSLDRNNPNSAEAHAAVMLACLLALGALVLNLPGIAEELRQTAVALPDRVKEDDRGLAAAELADGTSDPWAADNPR